MSKTEKNLMDAFAGESQANRKYLAFAKQADKEGLPQVAKLFRAAAEAETIHAHAHLRNAGKIGDTTANLKAAIAGETYEFTKMYPEMIADAKEEGQDRIAKYFDMVNKVEEVHANLYKKALADPSSITGDLYVCTVCGYTQEGPCDKCPICGAVAAAFAKICLLYTSLLPRRNLYAWFHEICVRFGPSPARSGGCGAGSDVARWRQPVRRCPPV